jgi:DNA uptake protein ComE-like DNA-binding protein
MHAHNSAFVLRTLGKTRISACAAASGLILALSLVLSCSSAPQPSNQQLEQQAAQATEKAKQESKEALADARVAAANAEGKVNAIASGVQEGIHDKAGAAAPGADSRVDLNTASEDDLAALPGISNAKAAQIMRHRPYSSPQQLVARGVLSRSEFDRIAPGITVR